MTSFWSRLVWFFKESLPGVSDISSFHILRWTPVCSCIVALLMARFTCSRDWAKDFLRHTQLSSLLPRYGAQALAWKAVDRAYPRKRWMHCSGIRPGYAQDRPRIYQDIQDIWKMWKIRRCFLERYRNQLKAAELHSNSLEIHVYLWKLIWNSPSMYQSMNISDGSIRWGFLEAK